MESKKYHVKIHGIRPLLHHKFGDPGSLGKKARRSINFDPVAEADKALYKNPKTGRIYQPAEHLEGAMIKGAAQIQMKGKKTFKSAVAQSIIIQPREISLPQEYEVDITTGVIPATRGRVQVARPRWDNWELEFDIIDTSETDDINTNTMRNILEEAGKVGIGTFRLKYGQFAVDSVELIK